ncbi:MAG: hypothetical protein A3F68_11425 [Acidobacteria bacterium RIFCSPLOWO2_12_FULL_54_10]|nr:MAG: hypothetical protein A3F68_11425 [Acidobacteria bacterium RIFCSPLOWO2_12_FULL_54_10]
MYQYLDVFRGEKVPNALENYAGLIIMGGPMGVYEADRYPFLMDEQCLVQNAVQNNRPVLGICLGSQIIASALGARVYPGHEKEIGWYQVEVTENEEMTVGLPSNFMAFHWHGDTFDLPQGAVRLFRSQRYENQGFCWRANALAIQFHFEVSPEMIDDWLLNEGCCTEISALPNVKPEVIRQQTAEYGKTLEELSMHFFERFINRSNREK